MDFHSLTRRELQAFCKRNKIPANMTNVAMADALTALEIVVGIEDFVQTSQSETGESSIGGMEGLEVTSPYVPSTAGRSTRRRNVVREEPEATTTVTRTRRTARKTAATVSDESQVDAAETPAAVPQTGRKKVQMASACRKMNSELNECAEEENKVVSMTPAARRKKVEQATVQRVYSTRRSVRLAGKSVQMGSDVTSEGSELFKNELNSEEGQEVNQKEGPNDCTGVDAIETVVNCENAEKSAAIETVVNRENEEKSAAIETVAKLENEEKSAAVETVVNCENEEKSAAVETVVYRENDEKSAAIETVVNRENEEKSAAIETVVSCENEVKSEVVEVKPDYTENLGGEDTAMPHDQNCNFSDVAEIETVVNCENEVKSEVVEVQPDNTEYLGGEDTAMPAYLGGEDTAMPAYVSDEVQQSEGSVDVCTSEIEITVENSKEVDDEIVSGDSVEHVLLESKDDFAMDEVSHDEVLSDEAEQELYDDKDVIMGQEDTQVVKMEGDDDVAKADSALIDHLAIHEQLMKTEADEMDTLEFEESEESTDQESNMEEEATAEMADHIPNSELVIMNEPAKNSSQSLDLKECSLRSLTKMLKELMITKKSSEHGNEATLPRTALKELPKNQLVDGNEKNIQ